MHSIAKLVNDLRASGLSIADIAKRAECSTAYVSMISRGVVVPDFGVIDRLMRVGRERVGELTKLANAIDVLSKK